jgi:hypothetical protein
MKFKKKKFQRMFKGNDIPPTGQNYSLISSKTIIYEKIKQKRSLNIQKKTQKL